MNGSRRRPGGPPAVTSTAVEFDATEPGSAELVEELALAVACGGITHAVMMVSPLDLDDFVFGFCFSEGLIDCAADIRDWDYVEAASGWQVDITLGAACMAAFRVRQRRLKGASGCGLCGAAALDEALPRLPPLPPAPLPDKAWLGALRRRLREAQTLGPRTGAVHAALLLTAAGDAIACREDIGRHNALDKVIGAALRQGVALPGSVAVLSSRCSSELIFKAVRARLAVLVNLSAPSTLAVHLARRHGLRLLHLLQDGTPRVYA